MSVPLHAVGEPPLDPDAFRRVVGRFATGVSVLTTLTDGVDHAMTVSAFASVSLEPVLVLVCIDREARLHDAVLASGVWGVSVLEADSRLAAQWFATSGRPVHGQLERHPHHRGPRTGTALLDGALATLECSTWSVCDGGDHSIIVGEVLGVGTPVAEGDALVYHRGRYRTLPG